MGLSVTTLKSNNKWTIWLSTGCTNRFMHEVTKTKEDIGLEINNLHERANLVLETRVADLIKTNVKNLKGKLSVHHHWKEKKDGITIFFKGLLKYLHSILSYFCMIVLCMRY